METSLMVEDYPNPPETKEKCFQFDFNASIQGYGVVYAETKEEALEKINEGNFDDIIDTWGLTIEDVTDIKED